MGSDIGNDVHTSNRLGSNPEQNIYSYPEPIARSDESVSGIKLRNFVTH